jgi:fatty-acid desaturase
MLGWILVSGYGISIGFHRLFSHESFKSTQLVRNILAYLGCLGAQGSPLFWVAIHNGYHHPYSDTPKDIHSPINGYLSSYFLWQVKLNPDKLSFRSALRFSKEPWLVFLHQHYYKVFWATIFFFLLLGFKILFSLVIIPMFISIHQENCVNLFCHLRKFGYRNFDTADNSVNNIILGLFGFGQGWHNNHHAKPNRYNFGGQRRYEIDFSVPLINLIKLKE